jgi:hypothetical protein
MSETSATQEIAERETEMKQAFDEVASRLRRLTNDPSVSDTSINQRIKRLPRSLRNIVFTGVLVMLVIAITPTIITIGITAQLFQNVFVSLVAAAISILLFNIMLGWYLTPEKRLHIHRAISQTIESDYIGYARLYDIARFVPFGFGGTILSMTVSMQMRVIKQIKNRLTAILSVGWRKILLEGMEDPNSLEYTVASATTPGKEGHSTVHIRSRSNPVDISCEIDPQQLAHEMNHTNDVIDPEEFDDFIAQLKAQITQLSEARKAYESLTATSGGQGENERSANAG